MYLHENKDLFEKLIIETANLLFEKNPIKKLLSR